MTDCLFRDWFRFFTSLALPFSGYVVFCALSHCFVLVVGYLARGTSFLCFSRESLLRSFAQRLFLVHVHGH